MSIIKKVLLPFKDFQNIQFCFSFFLGWFVLGNLWNLQNDLPQTTLSANKNLLQDCSCPKVNCEPCNPMTENVEEIEKRNAEFAQGHFRSYRYKPLSVDEDEINRWRLLTKKYHYEMINQEPRVGVNGMWKEEVNAVDAKAIEFLKRHDTEQGDKSFSWELEDVFRHYDPFHGVDYIANYVDRSTNERRSVEMSRSYLPGRPRLVSIEHAANNEMINIISPISKVTERFNLFLERYEKLVLSDPASGPVRLLFVVFQPSDGAGASDASVRHAVSVLDSFKRRNPKARINYIFTKGEFSRAVGLHTGVMHCANDEIMLFLDIDLKIGSGFLGRVRRNTVRGKRVVFPIMYSQYDPDVMDKAAALNPDIEPLVRDKMAINKQTGFWIYYAYGVASMYKSDYLKVGGFRLDIRGWGGEDVDLFKKFVADKDLDVMSTVDKDLIHIYHSRGCDVKLAPDQYAMCVGAWAETLGSQLQVATLYLENHKDEV